MSITQGAAVWTLGNFDDHITTDPQTTQATGSTFIGFAFCSGGADLLPTSVSDTYGNTWTLAQTGTFAFGNGSLAMYYTINAVGGASHTFTASWGTGNDIHQAGALLEIKGMGAATFDQAPTGTDSGNGPGTTTSWAAPTITTPHANTVVVNVFCTFATNTQTVTDTGAPWAIAASQPTNTQYNGMVSWAIIPTSGTVAADTIGLTTADYVGALAMSFIPASTAPVLQPPEDPWDYSIDEYVAGDETTMLVLICADSAPVYRRDILQYNLDYFDVPDEYDDPFVSDAEWSSPIQPNAPSLITQFFGSDAEVLDEDVQPSISADGYIQVDATPSTIEDAWDYAFDEYGDDELALLVDYDARIAPPPATAAFQYFGDDAEWLIDDELSQTFIDAYQQADSTAPTSGATVFDEQVAATLEEEAEDFFADHFTNYDADQTFYDEQFDWDVLVDDDWYLEEFRLVVANVSTVAGPEDPYWLFDEHVEDDYYFDDNVSAPLPAQTPAHDDWDFSEEVDDDWLTLDNDDYDTVAVATASYYGEDAELLDEQVDDELRVDENIGPNFVPPAPPTVPEDAWDFAYDDIEDQWEIDELVGVSFVVPPAPPVDDAWNHNEYDDTADELVNDDPIGANAPVITVEDPWDFAFDDIEDQWEIDEVQSVDNVTLNQQEWDFAHDDIEDQWELDEVQSLNVSPLVEDGWTFEFDVIEDESFWHDEQTGINAIPKVSYYGEDAEQLDEQFDDELAQVLDTDAVGPDYQAPPVDDAWAHDDEVDDDWYNWPSESAAPNPSLYQDYGDDLLHFFDEMYVLDDDADWFAVPTFIVIPKRARLTVLQVITLLMVRR